MDVDEQLVLGLAVTEEERAEERPGGEIERPRCCPGEEPRCGGRADRRRKRREVDYRRHPGGAPEMGEDDRPRLAARAGGVGKDGAERLVTP